MNDQVIVKILRAFQPGDVVFIECEMQMTQQTRRSVQDALTEGLKDTGVTVVILEGGMKLAAREEVGT